MDYFELGPFSIRYKKTFFEPRMDTNAHKCLRANSRASPRLRGEQKIEFAAETLSLAAIAPH
jgi:hypothetical protein